MLKAAEFAYAPANCAPILRELAKQGVCRILNQPFQNGLLAAVQDRLRKEGRIQKNELFTPIPDHINPLMQMVLKAANAPGKHKASMLQDILAKRQTEVDFMNGAIAESGEKLGVPTPLNRALWQLVKGLEHSWSDPA